MNTIEPLGSHGMAGSARYPTSYRIRACPKCYGMLFWTSSKQRESKCDNCGAVVYLQYHIGAVDYARLRIRSNPFSIEALLFAVFAFVQTADHYLKLRKMLLFTFIRGLSHL
jgi:hypothetical protein